MKKIKVGTIVNTHGLRGDVKVKTCSDFPDLRFAKGAILYMQINNDIKELHVHSAREQKDMLLIRFENIEDINMVEPWKGNTLFIYENQLQELEEDEAYFYEMMDSDVYDMDDVYLGKVTEVIETGANVVLRVRHEEQQILIPFVKTFVKSFDKKEKLMHVEVMEGL